VYSRRSVHASKAHLLLRFLATHLLADCCLTSFAMDWNGVYMKGNLTKWFLLSAIIIALDLYTQTSCAAA